MYRQTYGPMNALADILGAYWEKQRADGALNDAANYNKQINDMGQQKAEQTPVQPENYGTQAAKNAADQLLPTQFGQQKNFGINGSILDAATQYLNKDPRAVQGVQSNPVSFFPQNSAGTDTSTDNQQQYDDFAAAKQANPEWYVGDTYVGDDAQAKVQAQETQKSQQATSQQVASNKYNQTFTNPIAKEYGFTGRYTEPMSYSDFQKQTNDLRTKAMIEMTKKYGADNAQNALKIIDSAISSRTKQYTDAIDARKRQMLARYLMSDDINTPKGLMQALWAATEYNNQAKQMGKPTIDTAMLGKMIDAGKVSITAKDTGGSINFYAVPKDGGMFDDGSYMHPILSEAKSITPDKKASIDMEKYKWSTTSANAQLQAQTSRANNAANIAAADRRASSRSSGGAGNPAETQRKAAMAIVQAHNAWVKNNFGADESDDPNYDTVQQAYKVLAGLSGGGSSSGSDKYGDYTGNDPVMQTIEKAIDAGVSGDEIRAKLREKGYGSQYDDAIPD